MPGLGFLRLGQNLIHARRFFAFRHLSALVYLWPFNRGSLLFAEASGHGFWVIGKISSLAGALSKDAPGRDGILASDGSVFR